MMKAQVVSRLKQLRLTERMRDLQMMLMQLRASLQSMKTKDSDPDQHKMQ